MGTDRINKDHDNSLNNKYSSTRPFTAFRPKQKIFKNLVSEKLLTQQNQLSLTSVENLKNKSNQADQKIQKNGNLKIELNTSQQTDSQIDQKNKDERKEQWQLKVNEYKLEKQSPYYTGKIEEKWKSKDQGCNGSENLCLDRRERKTTLEVNKRRQHTQNSVEGKKQLWSKSNEAKLRVDTSVNTGGDSVGDVHPRKIGFTSRIQHYKFMATIGQGSYAQVKLALDNTTGTQVAIKIYDKMKLLDPQKKQNVQREISILKQVEHKNIIKLVEVVSTSTCMHLVMEYIGCTSLFQYLKQQQKKRLGVEVVAYIIECLSSALHYLHSKEIVHRDIKLENIIINDSLYHSTQQVSSIAVKLIDFGFSVQLKKQQKVRVFCGTPCYMAPEMLSKLDFRAQGVDVWAVGIVLYVLMVGRFPFRNHPAPTDKVPLTQHQQEQRLFHQIRQAKVDYPSTLQPLCLHLLKAILTLKVNDRFQPHQILAHPWIKNPTTSS